MGYLERGVRERLRIMRNDWMPANNGLQLTIALALAPTEEGQSACLPFGEHRALAAERGC